MQGDKAARFRAELVELLIPLRRYCYSLTGNPHDADDLLHDTIERLLDRGAPGVDDLRKWAFRMCRNRWIDQMRSRKVRSAKNIEDVPEALVVDGESVAENRIELSQAEQAIASLAPEYREVLMLVAVEGMKYKEAAEYVGVPVGTVMSRLARARQQLADYDSSESEDIGLDDRSNIVPIKRGGK